LKGRFLGLDILRTIAIILVLVSHSNSILGFKDVLINKFLGSFGVEIFFILSGYLICKTIIENDDTSINLIQKTKIFYLKRFLRIVPNYYISILIFFLANMYGRGSINLFADGNLIPYFSFSQNLFCADPMIFPVAWSLSVEIWFYTLIPIVIYLFKPTIRLFLWIIVVLTVLKAFLFYGFYEKVNLFTTVITRIDSIFFGGLLFISRTKSDLKKLNNYILLIVTTLFIALSYLNLNQILINHNVNYIFLLKSIHFLLLDFGIAMLFTFFLKIKHKNFLNKIFKFTADISYSLYLYHFAILIQINHHLGNGVYAYKRFWLYSVVFSIVMYFSIEKPINYLKNKIK
jgi:peptidoglycan/LPS O-acetylase OafA/YrhL